MFFRMFTRILMPWWERLLVWSCFVFHVVGEVPPKYFWVHVANCITCGDPVNINRGSHDDAEAVRAACMSHFWQCRIMKRGKNAEIQKG